ncbi:MAG: hypothetical protein P1P87_14295 [Trueperaceae bacterium]|nr:hypothetical protein [Trueperaceae bacterium]
MRPWRWWHGAAPRRCDLMATYGAALVAAWATYDVAGSWLLAVIAADLGGGVVAFATPSTARWYAARRRPVHVAFVGVHVLHVVAAALVGGASPVWAVAVFAYAAAAVVLVRLLPPAAALPAAFALVVVASVVHPVLPGLAAFVALLLLKLVVGFAVHARRDAPPAPAPTLGC